jgi:phenylalanyl-tRNA synthetase beta chain
MKVSLKWLKDYVDFDLAAADLARRLTEQLTETEVLETASTEVRGVVAAKVVTVDPHPDADKLSVCVVDWGEGSSTVVCGAPNVRAGMVSALAVPGAVIAGGRKIEEVTLRGRRSHGMLVSAAELGLEENSEGILEFDPATEIGSDVAGILGLDDEVLDVDEQPNRPDCLGMIGIAREVAVAVGSELRLPEIDLNEVAPGASELCSVEIEDASDCPRYIARVISDVEIGPSPAWLASRLASVGLRSISNVVDVTNFVMLEYGHPIHAFDYDTLAGHRIAVRRARKGERLTTLDGVEHELSGMHLLICDGERAIAVAGVMGGGETEVSEATTNVLLECAWFDPVIVRRGAQSLGLRTDASQRFERGVDARAMETVAARACSLMSELAAGKVARGMVDAGDWEAPPVTLSLRMEKVRSMLAPGPPKEKAAEELASLGFGVKSAADGLLTVEVPSFRPDVRVEADLIEEVARIDGYDKIAHEVPFQSLAITTDPARVARDGVREAMVGLGFYEIMTPSFMERDAVERLGMKPAGEPIELDNPINKEMPLLRTTMLSSILDVVRRNANVGESDLRVFEIGKVFMGPPKAHSERWMLAGAVAGTAGRPGWDREARSVDFYDGKGVLWALAEALEVDSPRLSCYDCPVFERGHAAELLLGDRGVGSFGMLSREVAERWDLPQQVFVFELDLDALVELCVPTGTFDAPPKYPKSRRDLALVVDEGTAAGAIVEAIGELGERLLTDVQVFDMYRGDQLPAGKKSLGFSLTYMSRERTLTDTEVDEAQGRIVTHLVERFGASLRE